MYITRMYGANGSFCYSPWSETVPETITIAVERCSEERTFPLSILRNLHYVVLLYML